MTLQRTFELIPTTLVKTTSHKPPMTSKQVKRAYQKANQEKKVSRAEQRRLFAEELARQRKEYERVKSSERARVIRKKKAAKVVAEVERRNKAGLPKPSRLVRASQKSIAIFVKNTCNRKKSGKEIKINVKNSEGKDQPSINTSDNDEDIDSGNHEGDSDGLEQMNMQLESKLSHPPLKPINMLEDSEDEYGEFPFCTQLETISASISYDKLEQGSTLQEPIICMETKGLHVDLQQNEMGRENSEELARSPLQHKFEESLRSNLKLSSNEQNSLSCVHTSQSPVKICKKSSQAEIFTTSEKSLPCKVLKFSQNPCFQFQKTFKGSPSKILVQKDHSLTLSGTIPAEQEDQFSPTEKKFHETHFLERTCKVLPTNTAQETCELVIDLDADDFLSNSQVLNEINPNGYDFPQCAREVSLFSQKLEPPGLVLHSDLIIEANLRSGLDVNVNTPLHKTDPWDMDQKQTNNLDDLICTQDLVNMSQEICEMTNPLYPLETELKVIKPVEKTRERKRFFEEKEEDLLEAALYESRMINHASVNTRKNDKVVSIENPSRSSSLQALQPPLTITTENFSSQRPNKLSIQHQELPSIISRKQFQPLVAQRRSSSSPSSFSWENMEGYFDSSPSCATDYGMDEFSGDDWNELSALC